MSWPIMVMMIGVAGLCAAISLDDARAQQMPGQKPGEKFIATNAKGEKVIARVAPNYERCVRGGVNKLGYSQAAAMDYCGKRYPH
jgi:hypothetical protein